MQNNNIENDSRELNLKDIFYTALSRWYILLAALLICVVGAVIYTNYIVTPLYDSTGIIYISNKNSENISSADISASSYLTKDYEYLISDRAVLGEVSQELNGKYSYSQLKNALTTENPENTRFIVITVRTANAADSKRIVDLICEVSQEKITELLGVERVTIVRDGETARTPSYPNLLSNIMKSIISALIIYVIIICLLYFMNDKINTPEDIQKYLHVSVLGNIPYSHNKTKAK